jgi:hypothetical protein
MKQQLSELIRAAASSIFPAIRENTTAAFAFI